MNPAGDRVFRRPLGQVSFPAMIRSAARSVAAKRRSGWHCAGLWHCSCRAGTAHRRNRRPGVRGPAQQSQLPTGQQPALQDDGVGVAGGKELAQPAAVCWASPAAEIHVLLGQRPGKRLQAIAVADVGRTFDQASAFIRRLLYTVRGMK